MSKLNYSLFFMLIFMSSMAFGASFIDKRTGLEWQLAQHISNSWEEAVAGCQAQTESGGGWRLPNIKEAATVIRPFQVGPNVDARYVDILTGYQFGFYYTSTVFEYDVSNPFYIYVLSLTTGTIELIQENTSALDGNLYFCVRTAS